MAARCVNWARAWSVSALLDPIVFEPAATNLIETFRSTERFLAAISHERCGLDGVDTEPR
jgi:hypothetical protein